MITNTSRWIQVVAAGCFLGLAACHEFVDSGPPDFRNLKESRPVGNVKQLDVKLRYDVGALEVRADRGDDLFSVNLDYDANRSSPSFSFKEDGDRATMELSMDDRFGIHSSKRSNDLTLRLNDKVPMDLDFTAGVSDAHLDMTDLDITRFHLRGGVGRTEVSFDRPVEQPMSVFEVESGVGNLTIRGLGNTGVSRVKVDGGVGRTELDFTGEFRDNRVDTEINVGVGQVRLILPREVGTIIEAEGSFLSNISAPSFDKNNRTYMYRGSEGAATRIYIRVRSGVGGVTVELL
jgi:hypothetical protein